MAITYYNDTKDLAYNGRASWTRHGDRANPGYYSVYIYGLANWQAARCVYATVDDFGTLVRVQS